MSLATAIRYKRLRAPLDDGGTLIDPLPSALPELLAANRRALDAAEVSLQGRTLATLRRQARRQLREAARAYTLRYRDLPAPPADDDAPLLLAGHQPQLFHPGVWYKNFALSRLARQCGGTAVNLAIDSDTIKSAAVRVPGGSALAPRVAVVPLDGATAEVPYEDRPIVDRDCWQSFGARAAEVLRPLVPAALLETYWPLAVARSREEGRLGACLAQARHQLEGTFGAITLELPQSEVCSLEAFHWFTAWLLAQLPGVWAAYNDAVAEYRRVHHIRSTAHPVPNLTAVDGWLEAPLWVWDRDQPRRRQLFARQQGQQLWLADRRGWELSLPLAPDRDACCAAEQLARLAQRGVRLRTRALMTTLFARLVLGDLFLHGIGGAKYDQVTDALVARLFDLEPPAYLTVTATLRLPITADPPAPDPRAFDERLRQMTYHPERFLSDDDPTTRPLVEAKRRAIAAPVSAATARGRCREIRQLNQSLQPHLAAARAELIARRDAARTAQASRSILSSREYAFCLYPEPTLRALLAT